MDHGEPSFWTNFMPHGHCYLWRPEILWTHAISDAIIGAAYFSIPVVLALFIRRRRDVGHGWVVMLFAAFILACGTGHFLDIWNIWNGHYGLSAIVRGFTALVSIGTASVLWPLLPKALGIPSHAQLLAEIGVRRLVEKKLMNAQNELVERVDERTSEAREFSQLVVDREEQMIALKRQVNELSAELKRPPVYDLSFLEEESHQ